MKPPATAIARVLLITLLAARLLALDPNKALTQDVHRIWGQQEGLFQPTVYSIVQTHNGFLGLHFRANDRAAKPTSRRWL